MKSDAYPPPGSTAPEHAPHPPDPPAASDDGTAPSPAPDAITFEEIRERAYELWERNHRPEGFEIEFWLLAERELRKERQRRRTDEPTAP
ncbi:DUF2934 domain-containing protein [Methylobacterium sp. J-030]|uniref:DUF2934 domain-containing protein n=1 Tax=Methylobacterium sp. J-030 TaxID=2836627 RepID=UPI002443C7AE|nr:DUF2934 domain-containing protein [Methylobacterium sp. J-030]